MVNVLSFLIFVSGLSLDGSLIKSGLVHSPLEVDIANSLEAEQAAKPVLAEECLHSSAMAGKWHAEGDGMLEWDGCPVLLIDHNAYSRRATGSSDDPDYALYGRASAVLNLENKSLSPYNRIMVDIMPQCPGARVVTVTLSLHNASGSEGDGFNTPPGNHLLILDNYKMNRCYLEIADLKRDAIDQMRLSFSLNGCDLPHGKGAGFRIVNIAAQRIGSPEKISGWVPETGRIIHSMTGYTASGTKTAILSGTGVKDDASFSLIDAETGKSVITKRLERHVTTTGHYMIMDFTECVTPGFYRLRCGDTETKNFEIADNGLWDNSCWKILNFIYCQRCGFAVPGVHSTCHTDLLSKHQDTYRTYSGGWHDAGDLSQQTLQTADVTYALLELYDSKKQNNPMLAARLKEEALWGLEFVLKNRLGNGYHASSNGLLIWQDGVLGTHDDISSVRVQDLPYDNFLYSAYEAYASRILDEDAMLKEHLKNIACEDYDFALEKFGKYGFGGWISPYEHTYCTSESQFMATAAWAASLLYGLTGENRYADDAVRYADYVLSCQETEPIGETGISGFFYRNPSRKSVVHSIHQSREHMYMLALSELCRQFQGNENCVRWQNAMSRYGDYIKKLTAFTAPYGMLPSGVYRDDEYADTVAFYSLHLFPPHDAKEQFISQIQQGEKIAEGYYVKRFPVWFNIFNGNTAVHLSMGKSAAICASCLDDNELKQIAIEQLYWVVGKNPFAQSLIYGEGYRYPDLNNFTTGRTMGAIPVGIRSLADSDEPYWPQINNACYKEVWVTSAGKWLSLIAELENTTEL